MFITEVYKYEKGGIIYVSGNLPEGSTLIEEMDILSAEDGNDLIRKTTDENVGPNVWLHNGDVKENYKEEKHKEPSEP